MEENKKFRNHISIVAEQVGGAIAALFIIVITQLFQQIGDLTAEDISFLSGKSLFIILGIMILLAAAVGNRLLVWARTYISLDENAIVIERDTINKKKNTIGIKNISNINLEQNLFEMLMGTCKVKLDTNSRSTADSTDVKIVLKKKDAQKFKQMITARMAYLEQAGINGRRAGSLAESADLCREFSGSMEEREEDFDIVCDFKAIFRHGIYSISVLSLLILLAALVGTITAAVQTFGDGDLMKSALQAAGAVFVSAIIVLSAVWDIAKDFVRYYNFRAKRSKDKIHIRYGVLKKVEYTVPVDKIQALKIRQSFIARLAGKYMAEIVNIGMGDDQEERRSFLVLYEGKEKFKENLERLLPEYADAAEQEVERAPRSVWAAWTVPMAVYLLCVTVSAVAAQILIREYVLIIWLSAAGMYLMGLITLILRYVTCGTGAGEEFLKISQGYCQRVYIAVRYSKIQYAEFHQNFIAKACGIRRGRIHLLAASADAARGIPYFRGNADDKIKCKMLERH